MLKIPSLLAGMSSEKEDTFDGVSTSSSSLNREIESHGQVESSPAALHPAYLPPAKSGHNSWCAWFTLGHISTLRRETIEMFSLPSKYLYPTNGWCKNPRWVAYLLLVLCVFDWRRLCSPCPPLHTFGICCSDPAWSLVLGVRVLGEDQNDVWSTWTL